MGRSRRIHETVGMLAISGTTSYVYTSISFHTPDSATYMQKQIHKNWSYFVKVIDSEIPILWTL